MDEIKNDYDAISTKRLRSTIKDVNGKEIKEGDIVRAYNEKIYVVNFGVYQNGELYEERAEGVGFFLIRLNSQFYSEGDVIIDEWQLENSREYGCLIALSPRWKYEIIGNKYDNPELLHRLSQDIKSSFLS